MVGDRFHGVLMVTDAHDGRVHDHNSIAALRAFADPLASKIARDELEESIRRMDRMDALGQLAGGVAHDINNLLMPVLGLPAVPNVCFPPLTCIPRLAGHVHFDAA